MITGNFETPDPWRKHPGPWNTEPDWAEFEHEGLPCMLLRGPSGAWSGYVHVPPYNPVWREYQDDDGYFYWPFDVHGGITWTGSRAWSDGKVLFTLGFDCNHSHDGSPEDLRRDWRLKGGYRTLEYAMSEACSLAEQVSAYKPLQQVVNLFSGTSEGDDAEG